MARILLIDDEARFRSLLAAGLRRAGHQATTACDGLEAVVKFRVERFDLVITDIVMPRMDGIETIRALRQTEVTVPIIAMSEVTCGDRGLYLKAALALGADATLEKPFSLAELQNLVQQALAIPTRDLATLWYR